MAACVCRLCVLALFLAVTNVLIIGSTPSTAEYNPTYTGHLEEVPAFDVHLGRAASEHSVRRRRAVATGTTSPGTTSPGTTSPGTTPPGTTPPGTTPPGTTSPGTTPPGTTSPGTTRINLRTTSPHIVSTRSRTTTRTTTTAASGTTTTSRPPTSLKPTVNEETNHTYYTSRVVTGSEAHKYFINYDEMKKYGLITHGRLSASHRISQKIPLRFTFHFYGHDVTNVTIATGGFLYMSDFLHRWLTATQYIAPLMANFDTSLRNESRVHYADNGTAFIVLWEDVHLHDDVAAGPFTFEVILHKDGTIIFSYYQIPKEVLSLSKFQHPVKVGLSDAYYMDEVFYSGGRRRTIFEYHRVKINMTLIASHTAVIITPLPTCNIYKNCSECLTASTNFKCMWCPAATRCSSGLDRKRQEWLQHRCHLVDLTVDQCPKSPVNFTTMSPVPDSPSTAGAKSRPSAVAAEHSGGAKPGVIIAVLLVVCLVCGIASWLLYAYLKPQSKSGLWLIEHRPSRVREQLRSVMFKKDTNSTDA